MGFEEILLQATTDRYMVKTKKSSNNDSVTIKKILNNETGKTENAINDMSHKHYKKVLYSV